MTALERRHTASLAAVFAFRMFGLFMVLPVLMLYVDKLPGATPALLGTAAGIYGLTQAAFQLPFGILSDHLGRKQVIMIGLVIFMIGSCVAAFSNSIWGLILGRAIQGMGAIGAVVLAFLADLTRASVRTKAMAIIGLSIGATFVLSFLLGPLLESHFGLSGLFIFTALMGALAMGLVWTMPSLPAKPIILIEQIKHTLKHTELWQLNFIIFILHALLTSIFLIFPLKIQDALHLSSAQSWQYYLPVLLISIGCVAPFLRRTLAIELQKARMQKALLLLGASLLWLMFATQAWALYGVGILFFIAFNYLEALLPAAVSLVAHPDFKGTALGIYSLTQFLGMFVGGVLGGILLQWQGQLAISAAGVFLTLSGWIILAIQIRAKTWQEASIKSF